MFHDRENWTEGSIRALLIILTIIFHLIIIIILLVVLINVLIIINNDCFSYSSQRFVRA